MSTIPENELDLDKLFLPAWAQESATARRYTDFVESDERPARREERRGRRLEGSRPQGRGRKDDRPRGPRRDRENRPRRKENFGGQRHEPRDHREYREPLPLPEINISLRSEEKGVELLTRQIKTTARAYPLFEIAALILQKPDRFTVTFNVEKKPDGQIAQPLFLCALDDTLWLSEDEAVAYVLKQHFAAFYQAERTATEPPKGKYTFVAQCGMSGAILGPPNYHDYQNKLLKLHTERFSRMPFEVFKSRVKIVRDEEVVKKWVEDQSWKTEYICLNVPEPLKLPNMEEVEKHFRTVHKETIIKSVESHTLGGMAARSQRCHGLARAVRQIIEDQRRFPLQVAMVLSQQFASRGLQFFKVNKTYTHVCVARPHFLDLENTPVSDGVKHVVDYINANPKCSRRKLMESLAPTPATPAPESGAEGAAPGAPANEGAPAEPAAAPASVEPTPEQTAIIADLHWLIHQGHVIEFADGRLETAKKPAPKPLKPA
ncbi:MAG TPA: hypothetical protein VKA67_09675, partial [Verrucomicrobiae bacterium]|nr:hypothetical protein [Verrucomicrobiae bacterium]